MTRKISCGSKVIREIMSRIRGRREEPGNEARFLFGTGRMPHPVGGVQSGVAVGALQLNGNI